MPEASSSALESLKTSFWTMRKLTPKRNGQRINVGGIIAPEWEKLQDS